MSTSSFCCEHRCLGGDEIVRRTFTEGMCFGWDAHGHLRELSTVPFTGGKGMSCRAETPSAASSPC